MLRLVINLDRSPERWHAISERLQQLNIEVKRVPAVDGSTLSNEYINSISAPIDHPLKVSCPGELTVGEIGCYLSHIKCWEELVQSNEKWALIIEDDIAISSRAQQYMLTENWIPAGADLVQLHGNKSCDTRIRKERIPLTENGVELVRPIRPTPVGTLAYIISREAATYAIEHSKLLACPVDEFLVSPYTEFPKRFNIWRLDPCVVSVTDQESTLGARVRHQKSPLHVLIRRRLLKFHYKLSNWNCVRKTLTFQ